MILTQTLHQIQCEYQYSLFPLLRIYKESSEKLLYALLITLISKNDYSEISGLFQKSHKILLTTKQMYSIYKKQFGVMSSEFGVQIKKKEGNKSIQLRGHDGIDVPAERDL